MSALQVFYDGACPLCRREIAHYRRRDWRARIEWVDISRHGFDARAFGLDPARVNQAMHARLPNGRVVTEVAAFVAIWRELPAFWNCMLRGLLKIPGMMAFAGVLYRAFARNRYRLTGRCTAESCEMRP